MDDTIVSSPSASPKSDNDVPVCFPVSDDENENGKIEIKPNDFFNLQNENGSPKEVENELEEPQETSNLENGNSGIKSPTPTEITPPPSVEAPVEHNEHNFVVDDYSIADIMEQYIQTNRVNWAELDEINDLWQICDAVSALHGGLPDSLLKDAFLIVLQRQMNSNLENWARQHLLKLILMWKKEVQSEKSSQRPSKFVGVPLPYSPPTYKRRRTNADKKRRLKNIMAVGEVLQQARTRFATEEGELDVDEDEHGNISIGGCELSFETWGRLNKIKDADVVQTANLPPKKKRKRVVDVINSIPVQIPPTINVPEQPTFVKEPSPVIEKEPKPKPEKDEGELTESDDDSDSCSSSASDDNNDETIARTKRRKRRINERQQGGTSSISNMQAMFDKFFQYRFQICHALTVQQKSTFMDIIKVITN